MATQEDSMAVHDFFVDCREPNKKSIECSSYANTDRGLNLIPNLLFTHGAGGTHKTDAVVNFAKGYAFDSGRVVTFKGSMNLKSRIAAFKDVNKHQGCDKVYGGRSMGARAAVLAATEKTTHLVLVSYPLHTNKETRDQILLDLPADKKVIFLSGDHDNMCDLTRLQDVRSKMQAKSWLCVVESADHGMNVKPKSATASVIKKTGEIVANWVDHSDESATEGRVSWSAEKGKVQWSGWSAETLPENSQDDRTQKTSEPQKRKRKSSEQDSATKRPKRQSKGSRSRK